MVKAACCIVASFFHSDGLCEFDREATSRRTAAMGGYGPRFAIGGGPGPRFTYETAAGVASCTRGAG